MVIANVLSVPLRWFRSRGIFSLSFGRVYILILVSYSLEAFLYFFLSSLGEPVKDEEGIVVKAPSVDLTSPGYVYEWMFDVLYITCQYLLSCSDSCADFSLKGHVRLEVLFSENGFGCYTSSYVSSSSPTHMNWLTRH